MRGEGVSAVADTGQGLRQDPRTTTDPTRHPVAAQLHMSPRAVRELCSSRQITCIVTTGPKGQARYRISQSGIPARAHGHQEAVMTALMIPFDGRCLVLVIAMAAVIVITKLRNDMEKK